MMKDKMLFLLMMSLSCVNPQNNLSMETSKASGDSYQYRPEPDKHGMVDWVTFTKPNSFDIERTLKNGDKIKCTTKLVSSSVVRNAWLAKDVLQAISKESVQNLLQSEIEIIRLDTTFDKEGESRPFIFNFKNRSISILPPDDKDTITPRADKEIAGLVYVLTKVYKQQLNSKECSKLRDSE